MTQTDALSPDVLSLQTFCPHGCFVPQMLCLRMFCPHERFVCQTCCPFGCFVPFDVLSLRMFCPSTLCLQTLGLGTYLSVRCSRNSDSYGVRSETKCTRQIKQKRFKLSKNVFSNFFRRIHRRYERTFYSGAATSRKLSRLR
jgi:hypothetical protein